MTSSLTVKGRQLALDDGFLIDPAAWNDDVARALARDQEGLAELSAEHWGVIRFIRTYFEGHGAHPPVRTICKETGLALLRVYELFPSGPTRGAGKVAGLPRPDTCA